MSLAFEGFTADEAVQLAIEKAGSDDFGSAGWREGLERAIDAFSRISLTRDAAEGAKDKIVHDLSSRLRIEQWYKDHPEVEQQQVEGPVVVVGLPRTGTTATVGMLALDERFRFLRGWEANAPVPPPMLGDEENDPRVIAARKAAGEYGMAHMHLHDPDGPEEDLALLASLDMHAYHGAFPMPPDYIDWWLSEGFASTYAYLERVFKLLQSRRPPSLWLLKSPPHLFRLDLIARQFPDAKFVMTHRDPCKVLGSVASLQFTLYEQRCEPGTVSKQQVGRQLFGFWEEGMRRGLAAREQISEERFFDIRNDDVVKTPNAVFERVYAHLGIELSPELRNRLEDYNSRNAPGKFGSHRYTLEEYGLTFREVTEAFAGYIERFGL